MSRSKATPSAEKTLEKSTFFLSEALRFNPSTSNNVRTASSVPFASPNLVTTVKSSKYDVIRMPNRLHPTLFTAAAVRKNACTDAIAPKSIVAISEPRTLFWIGSYMQLRLDPCHQGLLAVACVPLPYRRSSPRCDKNLPDQRDYLVDSLERSSQRFPPLIFCWNM